MMLKLLLNGSGRRGGGGVGHILNEREEERESKYVKILKIDVSSR